MHKQWPVPRQDWTRWDSLEMFRKLLDRWSAPRNPCLHSAAKLASGLPAYDEPGLIRDRREGTFETLSWRYNTITASPDVVLISNHKCNFIYFTPQRIWYNDLELAWGSTRVLPIPFPWNAVFWGRTRRWVISFWFKSCRFKPTGGILVHIIFQMAT